MAADPGEQKNLYLEKPAIAKRLLAQLEKEVSGGRSTAGPDSGNDVDNIVLWKSEQRGKKKKPKTKKQSKAGEKEVDE